MINEKVDIDKLLVVTFTKAAAQEMRERIAERLYVETQSNPELSNQILLLSKASITTIDSFCLRVVKDNFFKINLDPNFRVGEQSELEILKLEALDELLEDKYEEMPEGFADLFGIYTSNKGDDNLRNIILKIYNFTRSCPYPSQWLEKMVDRFNPSDKNDIYQRVIVKYAKSEIENAIDELKSLFESIKNNDLAGKYIDVIYEDIQKLNYLATQTQTWDMLRNALITFEFSRANGTKGVPEDIKEKIKVVRDLVKKSIKENLTNNYFVCSEDEIFSDFESIFSNMCNISKLVNELDERYFEKKSEREILDFSDVAHFALNILSENEDIADMYKEEFDEILIDEYQDSNEVQELVLKAISKNNTFMVGDIKQSIYRFRQARPELFLNKYEQFESVADENPSNSEIGRKILLFKNFRSNENIIRQTNYIFENIMSKDIGEIDYTEDEFLKFGADCYTNSGEKAELNLIESKFSQDADEIDEELLLETKSNLEGRFIAKRIKELVGNIDVYDKKEKLIRKAKYKDFAILLRSTVGRIDGIVEELSNADIPFFTDNGGGYFENTEVQTILSVLRIIDNPMQDVPLVAVLRSQIGGFSIDELTQIRLVDKNCSYCDALRKTLNLENELSFKVQNFLDKVQDWREKSKYLSLWELLWDIYTSTGYYYYVLLLPDGIKRQANLKLLLDRAENFSKSSFKGVFNFLNFIDNIKSSSGDFGDSKTIGENEDVVRIMSIHKSKGLEFPIVILAGADKRFNTNDLSEDIILDQDMGFGVNVIDLDLRIKYPHVSKHAVSIKYRFSNISEEMRILYVALTRAREKLIVTSVVGDGKKTIEKYKEDITKYKIANSKSFLDWIGYTVVNKSNDWIVNVVPLGENGTEFSNSSTVSGKLQLGNISTDNPIYEDINSQMNWVYKNDLATKLPNKISISELKRMYSHDFDENSTMITVDLVEKPDFLKEEIKESGKSFGTLVHETLQKLEFNNYSDDNVERVASLYTDDKRIIKSVLKKINTFSKTSLFEDIKNAKKVYREKPFNLNINAKEIYGVDSDESIMVQGIIDLFYEDAEGRIILVDYKTDNVETKEELVSRYRIQLELYRKALEEIYGKKVYRTIIYSFKFEEAIYIS